jgi:hypothetical protein
VGQSEIGRNAQVKSETIEYRDGDLTLNGFVAFDDSKAGKRPGILVNPEGFGLGPHAKSRAERLAQLGYVALAADPFGGGAIAKDLDEAMKLATPLMSDTVKLRARWTPDAGGPSAGRYEPPGFDRLLHVWNLLARVGAGWCAAARNRVVSWRPTNVTSGRGGPGQSQNSGLQRQ